MRYGKEIVLTQSFNRAVGEEAPMVAKSKSEREKDAVELIKQIWSTTKRKIVKTVGGKDRKRRSRSLSPGKDEENAGFEMTCKRSKSPDAKKRSHRSDRKVR